MQFTTWIVAAVAGGGLLAPVWMVSGETPAAPNKVVVVELFTSEGCSSCPPADALLKQMAAEQRVKGAEIVALGFHVDYWDRLGWKDPFSSPASTDRQNAYAKALSLQSIYTPQMVVEGTQEFVGSDARQARSAVESAARHAAPALSLSAHVAGDTATVTLQVPALGDAQAADLLLVVTEAGLTTEVRRGENAGRHLEHAPVVRTLTRVGDAKPGEIKAEVKLSPDWKRDNLRIVAFAQTKGNRQILAAGSCTAK